jgi:hypothetical protein
MNDALAHETLTGILELIDSWGEIYDRRWGKRHPYEEQPGLDQQVVGGRDEVRRRTRLAQYIISATRLRAL